MSATDNIEQFRERLAELVGKEIDAETAATVADQFPHYVSADPSTGPEELEADIQIVAELLLAENVEEVHRQTDDVGNTSRLRVIIGGEKPNTTHIRSFMRGTRLKLLDAGVWESRLHVTLIIRGDSR